MRIKIIFSKNTSDVPNNNSVVLEYIHRLLGRNNEYHDKASSYNISHLYGGEINKKDPKTLSYPNGGYFIVSSMDKAFMGKILIGLLDNPAISHGMEFTNFVHISEQFMNGWNHFAVLSPFIIKGIYGKNNYGFMTLDGEYKRIDGKWDVEKKESYDFENVVREHLINKLKKINDSFDLSGFKVKIDEFDRNKIRHNKHKVKQVYVKNVLNFSNQCQLSIYCHKDVAELLYSIGIGQSTGAGFGTIYKTENHHMYRNNYKKIETEKPELMSAIG